MVLAAMGFATLGPLTRFAGDAGFTAVSFAVWRAIFSAITLVAILVVAVALRRLQLTPLSAVPRLERVQLVVMGVFIAGTTLGLFLAFERTTVALALIVFYTFPIIVAVTAVPVYGEHLGVGKLAAIGLASVGLVLLLAAPNDGGGFPVDPAGVAFAFGASLCQVGFALVGARGFRSVPALQSATAARGFALTFYVVAIIPIVLLLGEGASLVEPLGSSQAWVLIVLAGVIGAALPAVLIIAGYRRVGPTRGAVLMLVEPLTGVLLAALLLSERPTGVQLLGGLLVLAGAALVQLTAATRPQAETQPATD